jgi:predicted metalloprotease with PDZ domain
VVLTSVEAGATSAGFRKGDIAVALDGFRVRSLPQWAVVRRRGAGPELRVLAFRDGGYQEVRGRFEDRNIPASFATSRASAGRD